MQRFTKSEEISRNLWKKWQLEGQLLSDRPAPINGRFRFVKSVLAGMKFAKAQIATPTVQICCVATHNVLG
jgi:hypothetical protein